MTVINTNTASIMAQVNMKKVSGELEQAMERLSSGLRINGAADDAAGLAIVNRMESKYAASTWPSEMLMTAFLLHNRLKVAWKSY